VGGEEKSLTPISPLLGGQGSQIYFSLGAPTGATLLPKPTRLPPTGAPPKIRDSKNFGGGYLNTGFWGGCRCQNVAKNFFWAFRPSVLWHCWLGGRKGIRPVKNWVVGCWHDYLSGATCRFAFWPSWCHYYSVSCSSKIQIGLPFWYRITRVVPEKGPLNGWVCVCVGRKNPEPFFHFFEFRPRGWAIPPQKWSNFWRFLKIHEKSRVKYKGAPCTRSISVVDPPYGGVGLAPIS